MAVSLSATAIRDVLILEMCGWASLARESGASCKSLSKQFEFDTNMHVRT